MAKKVYLKSNGTKVYPVTITDAVVHISGSSKTKLSDVIGNLGTAAAGWTLEQDADNSLIYYLKNSTGETKGTINIPVDTFLQSASVTDNKLTLTFNTASGKEALTVDLSKYIDVYTAGNGLQEATSNQFSIKIDSTSDSALSVGSGGLKLDLTEVNSSIAANAKNITALQTSVSNIQETVSSGLSVEDVSDTEYDDVSSVLA